MSVDSLAGTARENWPLPSVMVAVVESFIFTVAPAMGLPEESTMYPVILGELLSCPTAIAEQKRVSSNRREICFIIV